MDLIKFIRKRWCGWISLNPPNVALTLILGNWIINRQSTWHLTPDITEMFSVTTEISCHTWFPLEKVCHTHLSWSVFYLGLFSGGFCLRRFGAPSLLSIEAGSNVDLMWPPPNAVWVIGPQWGSRCIWPCSHVHLALSPWHPECMLMPGANGTHEKQQSDTAYVFYREIYFCSVSDWRLREKICPSHHERTASLALLSLCSVWMWHHRDLSSGSLLDVF